MIDFTPEMSSYEMLQVLNEEAKNNPELAEIIANNPPPKCVGDHKKIDKLKKQMLDIYNGDSDDA